MQRCGDRLRRDHDHKDDAGKPEVLEREIEPREAVAHQRAHRDLQQRDRQRNKDRIDKRLPVGHKLRRQLIIRRRKVLRDGDDHRIVQIALLHEAHRDLHQDRLQDQKAHPEQKHRAGDLKRNIGYRPL